MIVICIHLRIIALCSALSLALLTNIQNYYTSGQGTDTPLHELKREHACMHALCLHVKTPLVPMLPSFRSSHHDGLQTAQQRGILQTTAFHEICMSMENFLVHIVFLMGLLRAPSASVTFLRTLDPGFLIADLIH
ncbi:hypothetical protein VNO77_23014 [Canavalia gladiata]|uniref:Secreted protein n=1 Tax=Canavalia gladiata TaxID=3824 RepID=A0AAN9L736_CANGL